MEHKPSNIIYYDLIKQIYPGNSSYTVQTGGRLKALRESTTIEKVRAYHKKYYRPENTYLTITGGIEPAMIFAALDPVERKLMAKMESYPDWEKPFGVRIMNLWHCKLGILSKMLTYFLCTPLSSDIRHI